MKNITYEAINFNTAYTGAGIGPSPLMRNVDIRNVTIDGVPDAIVLNGLPEKWLENIHLENITALNTKKGIRLARVKNLTMKNIRVESKERALVAEDVYEFRLEKVILKDKTNGAPILLKGKYTGAVIAPGFTEQEIEFKDGADKEVLLDELPTANW
jgi:hypothetical protein